MNLPIFQNDTFAPPAPGQEASISLGQEVIRIKPHWPVWMALIYGVSAVFGVTVILFAWRLGLGFPMFLYGLWNVVLFGMVWQIKPREMIFCDHGLWLRYWFQKPVLLPYASFSRSNHFGAVGANGRTYLYGSNYVEDDLIERCFIAAGKLAKGGVRVTEDPRVAILFWVAIVPPAVVVAWLSLVS